MATASFAVTLRDREGNEVRGATVLLVNASSRAEVYTMTELADRRGTYYVNYNAPDSTLYMLKINGTVADDLHPYGFYLPGAGGTGADDFTVKLYESVTKGQVLAFFGSMLAGTSIPVVRLARPADQVKRAIIGVATEAGTATGLSLATGCITARKFGLLDGLGATTYPGGTRMFCGTTSAITWQSTPARADMPTEEDLFEIGYGAGVGAIFITMRGVPY